MMLVDVLSHWMMTCLFILMKMLHTAANIPYYIHKQCRLPTHLFSQWELELSTCTVSTGGLLLALTPTPPSNPGNGGKAVASRSNCIAFEEFVPVLSLFRGWGLPPEVGFPLPTMDDALPGPITSSSFLLRRCLQSQQRRNQPNSPNAATQNVTQMGRNTHFSPMCNIGPWASVVQSRIFYCHCFSMWLCTVLTTNQVCWYNK